MSEIIRVNTKPVLPVVKIGDIVQFDDLSPVKVVGLSGCSDCHITNICNSDKNYCRYISEDVHNPVMFAEVKNEQ